nr:hypothetical protein [Variovorax terrae]
MASAQSQPPSAADPAAPAATPVYASVFSGPPAGVERASTRWQDAHAAVARFPRGHADIVAAEAAQQGPTPAAATPAPATPTAPSHHH